jgi:hypothetical protein
MLSIFTISTSPNRELYLKRLMTSVMRNAGSYDFEHVIFFQGTPPTEEFKQWIKQSFPSCYNYKMLYDREVVCVGFAIKKLLPYLKGDIIMKLDDDAKLYSEDFVNHINAIHQLIPDATFSPYPVGLIGNPGGVLSQDRCVKYSQQNDIYYTFRKVHAVGGLARISPRWIYDKVDFIKDGHIEDGEYSAQCRSLNLPMYYLENNLVVEHQESTLGQHERYGDNYFKGKF